MEITIKEVKIEKSIHHLAIDQAIGTPTHCDDDSFVVEHIIHLFIRTLGVSNGEA